MFPSCHILRIFSGIKVMPRPLHTDPVFRLDYQRLGKLLSLNHFGAANPEVQAPKVNNFSILSLYSGMIKTLINVESLAPFAKHHTFRDQF
jgi:hypothetical protein